MFSDETLCQLLFEEYELKVSQIKFIDHSENILYKIVANTAKVYTLKIHLFSDRADFEAFAPDIHSERQLEEMMIFLFSLSQHHKDFLFKIPHPIPNNDGRFISSYKGIYFSLVTWCPGEDIESKRVNMNLFFDLGKALANFHLQCKNLFPECLLSRPVYDTFYLDYIQDNFRKKVSKISLPDAVIDNIYTGFDFVKSQVQISENNGVSIIHGDMSPSNVVSNGSDLYLIDFSFIGLGSIYQDLAWLSFELSDKQIQTSIFSGYKTISPSINLEYVKFYEVLRVLLYIVANISGLKTVSWISQNPLEWVDRLRSET